MTITIRLKTGNAAFEDDRTGELARIMAEVAHRFTQDALIPEQYNGPVRDYNGNTVGSVTVTGR